MKTLSGDLADRDVHDRALQAQPRGQHRGEEPGVDAEEEHLEDGVEGHESRAVLGVALGQVVPHDDHGDAARQADEDQAQHVLRPVAQEEHGQAEHEQRTDDPVLQERQAQHLLVLGRPGAAPRTSPWPAADTSSGSGRSASGTLVVPTFQALMARLKPGTA